MRFQRSDTRSLMLDKSKDRYLIKSIIHHPVSSIQYHFNELTISYYIFLNESL